MDSSETLFYFISSSYPGHKWDEQFAEEAGKREGWVVADQRGKLVFVGTDGHSLMYHRESATSCMIWDVGFNGKDENGGGDDISISLKDGKH